MSKATAQDVFKAFQQFCKRDPAWYKIDIFSDESGSVRKVEDDEIAFCFTDFDEAVQKIDSASQTGPQIGDAILYIALRLKVTEVFKHSRPGPGVRAADEKNEIAIYIPSARLVAAGVRAWRLAA